MGWVGREEREEEKREGESERVRRREEGGEK